MLSKRPEIDKIENPDQRSLFNGVFEESFGNPIAFSAAPALADMEANTWGYYSTDLYIKFNDNTGIVISGTAMT